MSVLIDRQMEALSDRFPGASAQALPSGTRLVSVPTILLPPGWSAHATGIRFLIPTGYPFAALDCFWADDALRLSSGNVPQNAAPRNPIPETNQTGLWFSWHLASPWNANRDTLSSWMNVIADRLRRPQ